MAEINAAFEVHKAHFGPISQGLIDYVTNHVLLSSRYLFTKTFMRMQYAYCTHCKENHKPEEPLKHNSFAICPKCHSKCEVKKDHVGRKYLQDKGYVVYYEKSILDPTIMTAVGFFVKRDYSGDYKEVQTLFRPSCSYVFKMGGKTTMFYTGYYDTSKWHQSNTIVSEQRLYKNGTRCYYSRESIKEAIVGTPLQYSTWESYEQQDMVKFFGLYTQYPCIEYLTKMNCDYFVMAKLWGFRTYDAIKWSGKTVEQVFKLSKKDLKQFRENIPNIRWRGSDDEDKALLLRLYQLTLKDSNRPTIDELKVLVKNIGGYFQEMKSMFKFQNIRSCVSYVMKQYKDDKGQHYYDKSSLLLMWQDYIKQCKELGFDLKRLEVVFPHNLHKAHESTSKQVKIKLSKEEALKIKNRSKILESYRFSYDGYIIRAAVSGKEIIEEGKTLRHCVGGYAKDHADGKTNIFVIRKFADPDTPFFTMELKDGKITQTYGYQHLRPSGDLLKLLEAFNAEKIALKPKKKIKANRLGVAV